MCAIYGVFGDRQGFARSLQPSVFNGVVLEHVHAVTELRKHWTSDKYFGVYGGANVFIKTTGVHAEYATHQIGMLLGFGSILLPAAFDLEQQLMITPAVDVVQCGDATCSDNCANPGYGVRHAMIAALDYIMGNTDRPMNCHFVRGQVFAIDNDSITDHRIVPVRASNNYQWQYVPDRVPLRSLCALKLVPRPLNLHGVRTEWIVARYKQLLQSCAVQDA
jgi:hypothetical protein